MTELRQYADLLGEIKSRIQAAQTRAVLAVNAELIALYWQVGHMLHARQAEEGWGAGQSQIHVTGSGVNFVTARHGLIQGPWSRN